MNPIFHEVITWCCENYKIKEHELKGDSRFSEYLIPRHVCWYLLCNVFDYSPQAVATEFKKDRTTVTSALDSIDKKLRAGKAVFPDDALDFIERIKTSQAFLLEKIASSNNAVLNLTEEFFNPLHQAMRQQFKNDPAKFYFKLSQAFLCSDAKESEVRHG